MRTECIEYSSLYLPHMHIIFSHELILCNGKVNLPELVYYFFFVLDDVPVPSGGPFVLCDYGAADGGASHDLIANIIGKEQLQKQRRSNVCEIPR